MASDQPFSWRRSVAWAVSLALHLGLLLAMTMPGETIVPEIDVNAGPPAAWVPVDVAPPAAAPRKAARVERMSAAPVSTTASPPASVLQHATSRPARGDRSPIALAVPPAEPGEPEASATTVPVPRTILYLDDEARALLPKENLYSAAPPPREGDYYTPGNGTEDDVFYRPRALDPNPSRFAHAWRPRGSLIDDWLGQLVEKTTGQVSVPLNAKFSLVCKASIAGLGGGCTIVRNGGTGVIVQRPPPAPWDRSNRVQCRELREALEGAEEAAEVAYYLDRLSALCSGGTGDDKDEARREAGLPGQPRAPDAALSSDQRDL